MSKYKIHEIDTIENLNDVEFIENIYFKQLKSFKKNQKEISKNKRMSIRNNRKEKEMMKIKVLSLQEE